MTLREAEDVAVDCRREASRVQDKGGLLLTAAEAIEYLLKELAEAEGYTEWLEVHP